MSRRLAPSLVLLFALACSKAPSTTSTSGNDAAAATASAPATTPAADPPSPLEQDADPDQPLPPVPSPYNALPEAVRATMDQPFTGDLDAMVERRLIRFGVVFNRTQYYIDKGAQHGIVYDSVKLFEEELNKRLKTGHQKIHVTFVPLSRDQLFAALTAGKIDAVAAALTITPGRQQVASFSDPTRSDVSEIVITSPEARPVPTPEALSGREVFIRRSSSYYDSIAALNERLTQAGKAPVSIREAPEALEDDDLLEMVNANLVDATVADDYIADFWHQVFPNMHLNRAAAVRTGGRIGVAVRKNNPRLQKAVNQWIEEYGPRTAFGNVTERKYLQNANYVTKATDAAERARFAKLTALFRKYGGEYSVDYLLMAAQGFQESRLDQSVKSRVGAVGVMQVMPATGNDLKVGDIRQVEPNIHAGVKYFRFMMDQYYKDEPMTELNKGLMTLASYNAGPARVRQLRREAARRGLDRNLWFGNVERIASERIGRETVQYVGNIYKYYVAYTLVMAQAQARDAAKAATKPSR